MSEEEKPKKLRITLTIPTKETIVESLKKMFPMIEVDVELKEEEQPGEQADEPQ